MANASSPAWRARAARRTATRRRKRRFKGSWGQGDVRGSFLPRGERLQYAVPAGVGHFDQTNALGEPVGGRPIPLSLDPDGVELPGGDFDLLPPDRLQLA